MTKKTKPFRRVVDAPPENPVGKPRVFRRPLAEIPESKPELSQPEPRKIPLPAEPEPGFWDSLLQQVPGDLSAARVLVEQKDYGNQLVIFGEMERGNPVLRVELSQNGVTRYKLVSADNAVLLCENLGIFLEEYVKK